MAQVFLLLKGDGSPWFSLEISTVDRSRFHSEVMNNESEALSMWYQNPGTNENLAVDFYDTGIPIIPHSWYHVCLGLDTESGLLRIVVNGVKVVDEEKEFFRNTSAWKPQSLAGKLLMFKSYKARFWEQNRGKFSNMNIFSSMMSLEDMMMRTSGYSDCTAPGDYLSWADMEWSVSGNVASGVVVDMELCQRYKRFALKAYPGMALSFRYTKTRVLFPSMTYWSTCMDQCLMYSQARAPSYSTHEELGDLVKWALDTMIDKEAMARGKQELKSAIPSPFFWMAYRLLYVCLPEY